MSDPVTKTTYTVVDFLEWQRQGTLDLRPIYQRRSVWNPRVKSLLIDSLLRGYPLPLIFLHNRLDVRRSVTVRQVVDGQQRLRTILAFVDIDSIPDADDWDNFTVLRSHNREYAGLSFQQLEESVKQSFLQTPLSVNVLPSDVDDVTVLSMFQRMNSTGLKLNDQEIRNASFFGEFKELSYALAYEQHQRWMNWGIFTRQDVAGMKEVELTSDLLACLVRGIAARTKSAIDRVYKEYDDAVPNVEQLGAGFSSAFDELDRVYRPDRSRSGLKRFRSTGWFYSVFCLSTGSDVAKGSWIEGDRAGAVTGDVILEALEAAELKLRAEDELDDDLLKVLRGATADRRSRELRVQFLRDVVDEIRQ